MKLFIGPLSAFSAKVEIALAEKSLETEKSFVPFSIAGGYSPKHETVARINPKGQVPVLIDGDIAIFDSTQIFEYLEDRAPDPPLWPRDRARRAEARLVELMADEIYFPHVIELRPIRLPPLSEESADAHRKAVRVFQGEIDARLDGRDYIVGEFSYADIGVFAVSFWADFFGVGADPTHRRFSAWYRRVAERPSAAAVIDRVRAYFKSIGAVPRAN